MNTQKIYAIALALVLSVPAAAQAEESPESRKANAEMKQMLGTVPSFLRVVPDGITGPFWELLKGVQLNPNTALDGRQKELIGVAVAAQVPCAYCVYFHTEAAKLNGGTAAQVQEAIVIAGVARHWSTVAAGQGKAVAPKGKAPAGLEATYKDIEATFGSVPGFLRLYPAAGLPGAWGMLKRSLLSNEGISTKERALIALAVSSQVPSAQCVEDYTKMAKENGATDAQIQEAVAMAAVTRAASTILNGSQIDLASFKKETDGIIAHVKRQSAQSAARR